VELVDHGLRVAAEDPLDRLQLVGVVGHRLTAARRSLETGKLLLLLLCALKKIK
jgi:hypothetical protein